MEPFRDPIAEGLKPAGKGRATHLTLVIRSRLPGLARLRACQGAGRRDRI
ncbi:MAG: hypothetical protein INF50_12740 [Rhodobacter sp.]|nr:hypothetical protein [Rhodobacter sp.]